MPSIDPSAVFEDGFYMFLVGEKRLAASTAASYISRVKAMLRRAGLPVTLDGATRMNREALEGVLATLSIQSRGIARSAWRLLTEFAQQEGRVVVDLDPGHTRELRRKKTIDVVVPRATRQLERVLERAINKEGYSLDVLKWGDLEIVDTGEGDGLYLRPASVAISKPELLAAHRAIRVWAESRLHRKLRPDDPASIDNIIAMMHGDDSNDVE